MTAAQANAIRVAVIGNVDSGKSTLVGVLTRGHLDDGRGKARSFVFHHKHELETGRSSAVTVEVMGFEGEKAIALDHKATRARIWQTVHDHADRSVTFVDLCGHEKYLKTTIFGLTGLLPDFGMVIVGANMGISKMTREHIGIATALGLPLLIVVTKIDIAPPEVYKHTLETVNKVLKQARRMPYLVKAEEHVHVAARTVLTDRITPIICISSVTGEGLDLLKGLMRTLPPRVSNLAARGEAFMLKVPVGGGLDIKPTATATTPATTASETGAAKAAGDGSTTASVEVKGAAAAAKEPESAGAGAGERTTAGGGSSGDVTDTAAAGAGAVSSTPAAVASVLDTPGETTIDSVFNVPGVGTVVAGTVMRGAIKVGATMLVGPDRLGDFQPVTIRSIHVQYTDVEVAYPGSSAAFAIRPKGKLRAGTTGKKAWVRKGMSLCDPAIHPVAYWEFSAEILILHHQTTMSVGYSPIMHCGVVTQTARITSIKSADGADVPALRTGDRAIITCRFMYRAEYIHAGDMLLFREGHAKGVGRIKALACPHSALAE